MAKIGKKNKDDVSVALGKLREELRQDTLGLAQSIEQLQDANGTSTDQAALANSMQALRQELRHEISLLSQQIEQGQLEQAQSMLVTPEVDTTELTSVVSSLREELRQNGEGLAESIEQLKASSASQNPPANSDGIAELMDEIRKELRSDVTRLSEQIEQSRLEQADSSHVPVVDTSVFSDAVQGVRDDLKRDIKDISQSIEQYYFAQPPARNEPKRSLLATAAGMLLAVAVGACGMALYGAWKEDGAQTKEIIALNRKVDSLTNPEHGLLKIQDDMIGQLDTIEKLQMAQASEGQDERARIHTGITDVESAVYRQNAKVEESLANIPDIVASEMPTMARELATLVTSEIKALKPPGAPTNSDPPTNSPADPPANSTTDSNGGSSDVVPVVTPKVIIDNRTRFDFSVKVNGKEVKVPGRRQTTVVVSKQGTVKTDIGGYVQDWDDWQVAAGKPLLKINVVERGGNSFKLEKAAGGD